ncbi:hypothetical protein Q5H93_10050 [Hymenobacter sp. ASUV-10]|uniref:CBM-cenC domain-containing protein n=1 Tax=Hymenobacter aranciens TaxID=3063996 RepID=A0ABT9BA64_9BACT|nr:hypothetical protein [Hymenobacter sp. ASUV-10]MDO7875072.1 hypothetical protein [Hymenobacter sp. ASUV-10]
MQNDFEGMSGWFPDAQLASISHDVAHSGRYSLRAGAGNEYSLSYKGALRQIFETRPAKIKVSGWGFLSTPDAKGTLVVAINDPLAPEGEPLLWAGLDLAEAVKSPNKWVEVSKTIELPATATPESVLTIYLWGNSGQPVYLDDIQLEKE